MNPPFYLPVLTYHLINPEVVDQNSIPPQELAQQMDSLMDRGYIFRSLPYVRWENLSGRKQVLITIDDAYTSTLEYAHPILSSRGIPYTVFVPTDYIGSDNLWNKKAQYICPHLSWGDIRYLQTAGVTIGSHGCSHHSLIKFSPKQVEDELLSSKKVLEDGIGQPVDFLAYPYGDVLPVIESIASQWYRFAFSAWQGSRNWKDRPWGIFRILVKRTQTIDAILDEIEAMC